MSVQSRYLSPKVIVERIGVYALLILTSLITIFPFFVCLITSFAPNKDINVWPPKLIPSSFTLDNYVQLFARIPVGRQFLNSILFAGGVTLFSVIFDSLAAYALSRLDFRGRNALLFTLIASMMIPYQALLIPTYRMLSAAGLVGSYNMVAMIIPRMADVAGIFLLRQFFISLPRDLDNAARIDGAGELRVFWSVVLPNAKQGLFTLALFNFMNNWNDLLWPLIMTSKTEDRTLIAGLSLLNGSVGGAIPYGIMMAGSVIAAVPLVIVFAFVQKQFVEGVAMSGMKG
ncbi:carbohydrate ABC transporter permease [Bifidobacterium simiiventris]|uniref:carbohydrate ABC transporter permease n=1 Tax=Bifidobacterium simiiventris TaxID=2834434 RepID=UPI001C583802|nr:carbohydrate ABC transporter permease [Bifidobacterium simiiventris]MBW3078477.1 carbohydrate ABC transporter permease [Bifidobacterium simiiventris]